MIKIKIVIVIFFFCFLSNSSKAQENISLNSIPRETVYLSTNSNMFLIGETIYYNFFNLTYSSNLPSDISKIGYVELVGENEEILFKHKIKLDKGIGYGDYFLPATVKTGQYKLIAYTKWTDDSKSNSAYASNVYIINPYIQNHNNEESESVIDIQIRELENDSFKEGANNIQIEINSNIVTSRSLVSIDLKNSFENLYFGNYSLSVRKISPI